VDVEVAVVVEIDVEVSTLLQSLDEESCIKPVKGQGLMKPINMVIYRVD